MSEKIIITTGPSECPKCGEVLPAQEIHQPMYEIPDNVELVTWFIRPISTWDKNTESRGRGG